MLAYIDNHNELTQSMINEYNSSLIFLGDEKQIFVPIINSYVGIGESNYQYLLNKIGSSDANFNAFNEYIHKDTVTSIYAQFTPTELEAKRQQSGNGSFELRGVNIDDQGISYTAFKANRNVVIKGLNQVNELTGNTIDVNTYSGIRINITHTGDLQTGKYMYNSYEYTYTYYAPYDIITVDDTYTWSYIGNSIRNSNTYMTYFVTNFATQQANRVYKNILGGSAEYIEKSFTEAFNEDAETGTLTAIKDVYVKTRTGDYSQVSVENTSNGYRITAEINGVTYTVYSTIAGDTVADLSTILADENNPGVYGGYYRNANNVDVPYWYNYENTGSAENINIADGIQTLKEVAYILDQITDGKDDDGIQLAYNIATNHDEIEKLKAWQNDIGNQTVSTFKSESNTNLLTVNYYSTNLWNKDGEDNQGAIGNVKLDLDLKLATTYELNGVTYAAYYNGQDVPAAQATYFITHYDETNVKNYIPLQNDSKQGTSYTDLISLIKSHPNYTGNDAQITLVRLDKDDHGNVIGISDQGSSTINVNQLTYQASKLYIYFPYTKANYRYDQGLTDVKWVTSYVGWASENLVERLSGVNDAVMSYITQKIDELDYTDTVQPGQFVTKVEETNGKIEVTRQKLPLDTILKNDVFYTNDIYVYIDPAAAQEEKDNNGFTNLYTLNNGVYTQLNQSVEINDNTDIYYKTSLASMLPVPAGTTVDTLLTNAGGVTYFYKNTGGTSNYVSYLPLDIQKENASNTLFTSDTVAADNTIYYLNSAASIDNIKYFDLSTIHMTNGSTKTIFTSYITYLAAASATNTGLADAWDVRRTIESLFTWVNVKTNKVIQ